MDADAEGPIQHFIHLKNLNWYSIIGALDQPKVGKKLPTMGSGDGARIVLCTEDGFKVTMHEVLIRGFTKVFAMFGDIKSVEELRDPYGLMVIILQEVKMQTLKDLSDFLYTGLCLVDSNDAKDNLLSLLNNCEADIRPYKNGNEIKDPEECQTMPGDQARKI